MANGKDLRRIALSLEGTTEAPHFDRAAFKVARIYATLAADGRTANLKLSPEEQEFKCMLAPEAFTPVPGAWGKQGWTTATLSALSAPELRDTLETAWRQLCPKSLPRCVSGADGGLRASARLLYSPLMLAALMIGHHFSISALPKAPSASDVCCSRGAASWSSSASRRRTAGSASAMSPKR